MIKGDGTINLSSDITGRNPFTGRYVKGRKAENKGKKWDDFMGKEAQERCKKGWANLDKCRGKVKRPDTAGRSRKEVVAVRNNGTFKIFRYAGLAAEWIGGGRENVCRCCRQNEGRHVHQRTGEVNTDHQYKGVRFYFASDSIWMEKIGHSVV